MIPWHIAAIISSLIYPFFTRVPLPIPAQLQTLVGILLSGLTAYIVAKTNKGKAAFFSIALAILWLLLITILFAQLFSY